MKADRDENIFGAYIVSQVESASEPDATIENSKYALYIATIPHTPTESTISSECKLIHSESICLASRMRILLLRVSTHTSSAIYNTRNVHENVHPCSTSQVFDYDT
jgi:hypothetical protein